MQVKEDNHGKAARADSIGQVKCSDTDDAGQERFAEINRRQGYSGGKLHR